MARNSIFVDATPDAVFDVLDDAYAYPRWVFGARRIRHVDTGWPAVGCRFHHTVGTFVAEVHDSTMIVTRDRPRTFELEVRFRPTGVAQVRISIAPERNGTRVTMEENPLKGPVCRIPRVVTDFLFGIRNAISLRRLQRLVENAPQPRLST